MTIEASLEYELTHLPLSLFSNKDHKMNKANKAIFSNTSLKVFTDPLDLTDGYSSSPKNHDHIRRTKNPAVMYRFDRI